MSEAKGKPIWARWQIDEKGRVNVIATYHEGGGYAQREIEFHDLDAAGRALGESFREVVDQVVAAGLRAGRWRP